MPKAKKTTISKSDFIRRQPATLSAAEVVAKAKVEGITIQPGLVYEVRRTAKAKKPAPKKPPTPSKTPSTTKSPPTTSKADFVRARSHLSPKEIVEDAKAAGITFDPSYVYKVRGSDKTVGKKKVTTAATRPTPRAPAVPRPVATTSKAETLLLAVAAEIGLGRAVEILAGERARVRSVIGG